MIKGEQTLAELAKLFDIQQHQITAWKAQLQQGAVGVFGSGAAASEVAAPYRRPTTSKPAPGHKIHPYRLRGLVIDRPNQV